MTLLFVPEGIKSSSIEFITIDNPVTLKQSLYAIDKTGKMLYQLLSINRKTRSAIVGNKLYSTTKTVTLIPTDPLFLVISALQDEKRFISFDTIFDNFKSISCSKLFSIISPELLEPVCDVEDLEGTKIVKLNEKKILSYLHFKKEHIVSKVIAENPEYIALSVLGGFVSREWIDKLVDAKNEFETKEIYERKVKKTSRSINEVLKVTNKKRKVIPKATKKLKKVDTTGMKKLSAFFKT
eukprot:maker-scaffold_5-snap-gene-19.2-mRNA-1 protein AED:0.00 eAED:0.00 QI:59/1/1/1/1/1/2/48/238